MLVTFVERSCVLQCIKSKFIATIRSSPQKFKLFRLFSVTSFIGCHHQDQFFHHQKSCQLWEIVLLRFSENLTFFTALFSPAATVPFSSTATFSLYELYFQEEIFESNFLRQYYYHLCQRMEMWIIQWQIKNRSRKRSSKRSIIISIIIIIIVVFCYIFLNALIVQQSVNL